MIRHLISILAISLIISSCGNAPKNESAKNDTSDGVSKVEFASLVANPADFIGKEISVEGKVVHVCTMSGKKLFIVGENPDVRLYIQAGENMPKFPMELLGSTVVVDGILTKVGGMTMGEGAAHADGEMAMQHEGMAADTCETESALAAQTVLADVMMDYKSHIVK